MSEINPWICFDFKDKTVQLTEYSMMLGMWHLHHWVIEGSNDGKSWTELDRRDTEGLSGCEWIQTYKCGKASRGLFSRWIIKSFRYLRLRQTGKGNNISGCLCISEIEFFGILKKDEKAAALRKRVLTLEEERRRNGEFSLCDDRPFWGIISHLSEECGGNVHVNGVVNITSSDGLSNDNCHHVADYGWNDCWTTYNEGNQWICFDFKDKTVNLTKYILKSGRSNDLRSWVIEGSNDGRTWDELDRRNTDPKGHYITGTYDCSGWFRGWFGSRPSGSFRYLRLRLITNQRLTDVLSLSAIEFFGTLHSAAN